MSGRDHSKRVAKKTRRGAFRKAGKAERDMKWARGKGWVPTSLVTVDANAVLIFDERERDTINTMIDFFRSSGEEENLDPEVYERIAEKLGNGRKRLGLVDTLQGLVEELRELAAETTGVEDNGDPTEGSAQHELWKMARAALAMAQKPTVFLLYDKGELIAPFLSLASATAAADSFADRAIDEWRGDQYVCHHFRDSFGAWTYER